MKEFIRNELVKFNDSDNGYIVFEQKGGVQFLQFHKQENDIILNFPISDWSKQYEEMLLNYLHNQKLAYEVDKTKDYKDYNLSFDNDLSQAAITSEFIWKEIFMLEFEQSRIEITSDERLSSETWKEIEAWQKKYANADSKPVIYIMVAILGLLAVLMILGQIGRVL